MAGKDNLFITEKYVIGYESQVALGGGIKQCLEQQLVFEFRLVEGQVVKLTRAYIYLQGLSDFIRNFH